jgi:ClpP class serine protease
MSREGLGVTEVTAGRFKRTLTPYKKPTDEDRLKVQEDLDLVLVGEAFGLIEYIHYHST